MKYSSIVISKKGGPEVLQVIEKELVLPKNGEVLIKIQACGVGGTDIVMRHWNYPGVPKIPFVPGYEIVGIVEDVGQNISTVKIGDRVGALTVYGGYSEYIYLEEENLVKIPMSVDSGEAAAVILNYTSAYQMMKKVVAVNEGNHVLITGASGGVGSALLDLGKMENLTLYGTASVQKHDLLSRFGAYLIDYKSKDFVEIIRNRKPEGLDFAFDGVGGDFIKKSIKTLHRGGTLVEYGYSLKSVSYFLKSTFDLLSAIPKGVKVKGYGISARYKMNKQSVLKDIAVVLNLLELEKVKPLIFKRMSLLEAAEANRLLESGQVTGKIVLFNQG
ncbi:MAG: medium chain dehydrogenase/reductase family protein [Sphingobacteriales bacterium]